MKKCQSKNTATVKWLEDASRCIYHISKATGPKAVDGNMMIEELLNLLRDGQEWMPDYICASIHKIVSGIYEYKYISSQNMNMHMLGKTYLDSIIEAVNCCSMMLGYDMYISRTYDPINVIFMDKRQTKTVY